jgi:hypothetical protein
LREAHNASHGDPSEVPFTGSSLFGKVHQAQLALNCKTRVD